MAIFNSYVKLPKRIWRVSKSLHIPTGFLRIPLGVPRGQDTIHPNGGWRSLWPTTMAGGWSWDWCGDEHLGSARFCLVVCFVVTVCPVRSMLNCKQLTLWWTNIAMENPPIAIFHCYVSSPEGKQTTTRGFWGFCSLSTGWWSPFVGDSQRVRWRRWGATTFWMGPGA